MLFSYSLVIVGLLSTVSCHLSPNHREIVAVASSASSASVASGQTPVATQQPTLVGPSAPPLSSGVNTDTSQLSDATLTATDPNIPPLSDITSGMPSAATPIFTFTAALGAPGPFPGAPPLPSTTLDRSKYPSPTELAPTDYPLMAEWLKELEGVQIPDIPPTTNESDCSLNVEAAHDTSRCWWSCGGCTNPTDIVTCEDKFTWGVTFDDGPSPSSPTLLAYLKERDINVTFFMISSNIYWFPEITQLAYLQGHQIGHHTWRHPYMTSLTNEQIVAELALGRQMIRDVIGVTPSYWRPPYGDVDDRVRAIASAMGLQTAIWTRNPATLDQFDTNDWRIPAGQVTGPQAFQQFENILKNATTLKSGFIVLEHDLYPETVDLAVGYTLPTALDSDNPKFSLQTIVQCQHLDMAEAYNETRTRPLPPFVPRWSGPFTTIAAVVTQNGSNSNDSGSGSSSGGSSGSSGSFALSASVSNAILAAVVGVLAVILKS